MKLETIASKLVTNTCGSGHWKQAFGRFQALTELEKNKVNVIMQALKRDFYPSLQKNLVGVPCHTGCECEDTVMCSCSCHDALREEAATNTDTPPEFLPD